MPKFQNLMQYLHPKVIIEKCEQPNDTARGKFLVQNSICKTHLEFENILISYVKHHMQEIFGHYPPPEFCLGKARRFLEESIGFQNCPYIALSGAQGGIPYLLNQVAEGFKKEAKEAYFTYVIDTYIDPLSYPDIIEVMREMKAKLGGYSPQSFQQYVTAEEMAKDYRAILWSYIDSLSKYKNLWTY